jgi:AcrR family transcriptional regulator
VAERERLDVDERRQRLIAVGRELFADRPVDDVSVEEIAEAAGISKGLLYHYFRSKRGFHLAVLESAAAEMLALSDAAAERQGAEQHGVEQQGAEQPAGDGAELRAALDAFVQFTETRKRGFSMLIRGASSDPDVEVIVDSVRDAVVTRIVEHLDVHVPSPRQQLGLRAWVGFVETATLRWLDDESGAVSRRELVELLAGVLESTVAVCDAGFSAAAR